VTLSFYTNNVTALPIQGQDQNLFTKTYLLKLTGKWDKINCMDIGRLQQESETRWILPPSGRMRTPAILYASPELIGAMDAKVLEQLTNIAALPGIETAAFAMPDAHWGYGFPIGGVAAFDAEAGGVVSAGGVGFDISCGVRTMLTGLLAEEVRARQQRYLVHLLRLIKKWQVFFASDRKRSQQFVHLKKQVKSIMALSQQMAKKRPQRFIDRKADLIARLRRASRVTVGHSRRISSYANYPAESTSW